MPKRKQPEPNIDPITLTAIPASQKVFLNSHAFNSHGLASMLHSGNSKNPLTRKNLTTRQQRDIMKIAKTSGWSAQKKNTLNTKVPQSLQNAAATTSRQLASNLRRQRMNSMHQILKNYRFVKSNSTFIQLSIQFLYNVEDAIKKMAVTPEKQAVRAVLPPLTPVTLFTGTGGTKLVVTSKDAKLSVGIRLRHVAREAVVDSVEFSFRGKKIIFRPNVVGNIKASTFAFSQGEYLLALESMNTILPVRMTNKTPSVLADIIGIAQGIGMHLSAPHNTGNGFIHPKPLFEIMEERIREKWREVLEVLRILFRYFHEVYHTHTPYSSSAHIYYTFENAITQFHKTNPQSVVSLYLEHDPQAKPDKHLLGVVLDGKINAYFIIQATGENDPVVQTVNFQFDEYVPGGCYVSFKGKGAPLSSFSWSNQYIRKVSGDCAAQFKAALS